MHAVLAASQIRPSAHGGVLDALWRTRFVPILEPGARDARGEPAGVGAAARASARTTSRPRPALLVRGIDILDEADRRSPHDAAHLPGPRARPGRSCSSSAGRRRWRACSARLHQDVVRELT